MAQTQLLRSSWKDSFRVGDPVVYHIALPQGFAWIPGTVIRKTKSGIPIVRCNDGTVWSADRQHDLRTPREHLVEQLVEALRGQFRTEELASGQLFFAEGTDPYQVTEALLSEISQVDSYRLAAALTEVKK